MDEWEQSDVWVLIPPASSLQLTWRWLHPSTEGPTLSSSSYLCQGRRAIEAPCCYQPRVTVSPLLVYQNSA